MITIMNDGRIVSQSRNLRGITFYACNVSRVNLVHIFKNADNSGYMHVEYENGSTCDTTFASYTVLKHFVETNMKLSAGWALADYMYQ